MMAFCQKKFRGGGDNILLSSNNKLLSLLFFLLLEMGTPQAESQLGRYVDSCTILMIKFSIHLNRRLLWGIWLAHVKVTERSWIRTQISNLSSDVTFLLLLGTRKSLIQTQIKTGCLPDLKQFGKT